MTRTRTASEGRACDRCRATEARCAWLSECCAACSHWTGYDAAGNELDGQGRPCREHATERGFQQHRYRREPPCVRCARAHSQHVVIRRRVA